MRKAVKDFILISVSLLAIIERWGGLLLDIIGLPDAAAQLEEWRVAYFPDIGGGTWWIIGFCLCGILLVHVWPERRRKENDDQDEVKNDSMVIKTEDEPAPNNEHQTCRFDQSKVDLIDAIYNHLIGTLIPEFDKYGVVTGWEASLSGRPKSEYMESLRQFRLSVGKAFGDMLEIYNKKPFYDDIKEVVESFGAPFKEFGDNSAHFFVKIKDKLDEVPSPNTVSLLDGDAENVTATLGPCDSALKKMKKDLEEMRKQEMLKQ